MTRTWISLALLASLACTSPPDGVRDISQDELSEQRERGALILDVRTPEEFAEGHVPGAVNIPHDRLSERLEEIEGGSERPVVVYCHSGRRAGLASSVLTSAGFTDVLHLAGDMNDWRSQGRPIEQPGDLDPRRSP